MTTPLLNQLARTTLLPGDMAGAIKSGNAPTLEQIVEELLIATMDVEAVVSGDPKSTWNEKRIARMGLLLAFLTTLVAPTMSSQPAEA